MKYDGLVIYCQRVIKMQEHLLITAAMASREACVCDIRALRCWSKVCSLRPPPDVLSHYMVVRAYVPNSLRYECTQVLDFHSILIKVDHHLFLSL